MLEDSVWHRHTHRLRFSIKGMQVKRTISIPQAKGAEKQELVRRVVAKESPLPPFPRHPNPALTCPLPMLQGGLTLTLTLTLQGGLLWRLDRGPV